MLGLMPIDSNPIEIEGAAQDHTSGQVVTCNGYAENDSVVVKYYHTEPGHDWFNETAAFRQVDHPECIGMNDYEYNSYRIWSTLIAMGCVTGEII